jgi:dTDP-4-dehydrorhamnose 3,5-epimerase
MEIKVESRFLNGVVVLVPEVFHDKRGFFKETFREDQFARLGLPTHFPQDTQSRSKKGVIRGLHFQWGPPIGKLMRVTTGSVFLVAVDIRKGSSTLGQWVGIEASDNNGQMMFAPVGFATGFCVTSEWADVQYKYTGLYNSAGESNIWWKDPRINIDWPMKDPILSERDQNAQPLDDYLLSLESGWLQ